MSAEPTSSGLFTVTEELEITVPSNNMLAYSILPKEAQVISIPNPSEATESLALQPVLQFWLDQLHRRHSRILPAEFTKPVLTRRGLMDSIYGGVRNVLGWACR
jgi:hypothetical protein